MSKELMHIVFEKKCTTWKNAQNNFKSDIKLILTHVSSGNFQQLLFLQKRNAMSGVSFILFTCYTIVFKVSLHEFHMQDGKTIFHL